MCRLVETILFEGELLLVPELCRFSRKLPIRSSGSQIRTSTSATLVVVDSLSEEPFAIIPAGLGTDTAVGSGPAELLARGFGGRAPLKATSPAGNEQIRISGGTPTQ